MTPASLEESTLTDPRWLGFASTQPEATVFHHPAWSRVLAEAYGYRPMALVQRDAAGEIMAGVPVLEMRGLTGRRFASLPFTDYCPVLGSSANSLQSMAAALVQWGQRAGAPLNVHAGLPATEGIQPVVRGVRHVLALDRPSEAIFAGLRGTQVGRAIRKARREGVEIRFSRSAADLEPFYALHLQTRRRQGVPIQPRRFLRRLWRDVVESGLGFAVFASWRGAPVATALFLNWNHNLVYKYGASDPRRWDLRPNNLVMWSAIEWGCQYGYRQLDFGRTELSNTGLRDFKSRWGAVETPLFYSEVGAAPPQGVPQLGLRMLARLIRSSPPIVCRTTGELLYGRVLSA